MNEKSLTGRTIATVSVTERGSVNVLVMREGRNVHSFTIGDEPDMPKASGTRVALAADKQSVEVFVDGALTERIPVV